MHRPLLRSRPNHACLLLSLLLAAPVAGQTDPGCLLGGALGDGFRYLWGGEMRHVFHRGSPEGNRVWVVGDGGQIRHSVAGGLFVAQPTPAGASQTLLDVYFLATEGTGWAAGVGGRLLKTTDYGASWTYLNGAPESPILNHCGEPATLWRARFFDAQRGFVCGLRTFQFTAFGGELASEWQNVQLFMDATLQDERVAGEFEFYGLELLGTPSDFVGVCIGQLWNGHPCGPTAPEPAEGVVFYTDSSNPASAGGRKWWITTKFDGTDPAHGGVAIEDPWDIEFVANPADIRNATGYLAGGTGNAHGGIYRTTTSGRSFTLEAGGVPQPINTHYGVGALAHGRAVACGYGGHIHSRDPVTGTWSNQQSGTFTGPLADVHTTATGTDDSMIVGSWGFVRTSLDAMAPWASVNPSSADGNTMLHRLEDIAFVDDLHGNVVGSNQSILYTDNGGCTWQIKMGDTLNPNLTGILKGVAHGENGQGVAVGYVDFGKPGNNAAYFTTDGGATWTASNMSQPNLPTKVDLLDVEHGTGARFWAVGTEETNQGHRPLVLWSGNGGDSFLRVPHSLPTDLVLTGVSFLNVNDGFVVGHTPAAPKAYFINVNGATVNFIDVSPTGLAGKLNGVAARGTSVYAASVYAVGGDYTDGAEQGYVLKFQAIVPVGQSPRFVVEPLAPVLPIPYRSVAMAQDGPLVLVGVENRIDELVSGHLGKALRFDGSTWTTTKAMTGKSLLNVFLRSQTRGWGVCRPLPVSPEFGIVNDTMLVIYDPL